MRRDKLNVLSNRISIVRKSSPLMPAVTRWHYDNSVSPVISGAGDRRQERGLQWLLLYIIILAQIIFTGGEI